MLMSSSKATGERVHVNPFFVLKRKIKLERKSKIERKKEKKFTQRYYEIIMNIIIKTGYNCALVDVNI